LGNQDDRGGQQGAEPHEALEPKIRRGVEGGDGTEGGKDVEEYPHRHQEHNAIEEGRLTSQRAHGFDGRLRAAQGFVRASMQCPHGLNILADMVRQERGRFVLRGGGHQRAGRDTPLDKFWRMRASSLDIDAFRARSLSRYGHPSPPVGENTMRGSAAPLLLHNWPKSRRHCLFEEGNQPSTGRLICSPTGCESPVPLKKSRDRIN